jgi:hypothetical protein
MQDYLKFLLEVNEESQVPINFPKILFYTLCINDEELLFPEYEKSMELLTTFDQENFDRAIQLLALYGLRQAKAEEEKAEVEKTADDISQSRLMITQNYIDGDLCGFFVIPKKITNINSVLDRICLALSQSELNFSWKRHEFKFEFIYPHPRVYNLGDGKEILLDCLQPYFSNIEILNC